MGTSKWPQVFPGIYGEGNTLNAALPIVKEVGLWNHLNLGGDDVRLEKSPFRLLR